jgi:hypothetical protein
MKLRLPVWPIPEDIPAGSSDGAKKVIWENRLTEYMKRESVLAENVKIVYSLIWRQCTDVMRQKIASHSYESPLKMCQMPSGYSRPSSPSCSTSKGKSTAHKLYVTQKRKFYNLSQDRHMTCQAYLEKFQNSVKVIEHCGGDLVIDVGLIDAAFATANPALTRDTEKRNLYKSCIAIY